MMTIMRIKQQENYFNQHKLNAHREHSHLSTEALMSSLSHPKMAPGSSAVHMCTCSDQLVFYTSHLELLKVLLFGMVDQKIVWSFPPKKIILVNI